MSSTRHADWRGDAAAARAAQVRLACSPIPQPHDLEVGVWSEPARTLSGDFYDVLALPDSRVALLVGDVSGKGAPAALIAASLQACLQAHLGLCAEICRPLRLVNQYLHERTAPHHFATLFLGVYDAATHALRYVNAGHNPPLLVRDNGDVVHLESTATIVGAFPSWECRSETVQVAPRDLLLAFTDGITESRDMHQREYGERRLVRSLRECRHASMGRILETIMSANRRFRQGERQDDVTLLAARARSSKEAA